jgi:hypothetical protein
MALKRFPKQFAVRRPQIGHHIPFREANEPRGAEGAAKTILPPVPSAGTIGQAATGDFRPFRRFRVGNHPLHAAPSN